MNLKYTFKDFISFDDVILGCTLGTKKLTPEGVAMQYSLWQSDTLGEAIETIDLLIDSGAEFNKDNARKMIEYYYERENNRPKN